MSKHLIVLLFVLFTLLAPAQKKNLVISGYIEDAKTGERLYEATTYCLENRIGVQTNAYGFFSLPLQPGQAKLKVSFIGYTTQIIELHLISDTTIVFRMQTDQIEIEEVIVRANKNDAPLSRPGQIQLSMAQVSKIPMVLGEPDLLKAYQMMPGVQSGMEGTAGMVVRGSDPGQNLILLDGVTVYNANHLFGFFSVFDTDAIKSSTLIKGAFPARYGGRASSVMDIRMKEGNNQNLKWVISVGLISSKIMLDGPINGKKTSFKFSARRTYLDLLTAPYQLIKTKNKALWKYNFHDINFKINHVLDEKNRLYLSMYNGHDVYSYRGSISEKATTQLTEQRNGFNWGNLTSTIRWNHQPSPKLFCNTTLVYSKYAFNSYNFNKTIETNETTDKTKILDVNFNSGIRDLGASADFEFTPARRHLLRFGGTYVNHRFLPGVNIIDFNNLGELLKADTISQSDFIFNNEIALYAEDEWHIFPNLQLEAGLRGVVYFAEHKKYLSIEPRLFVKYMLNVHSWTGVAYSKTSQNVHLLTNTSIGFPTDQWMPITDKVKPLTANQFTYTYNITNSQQYGIAIEGFYKLMNNLLEYRENANMKNEWQEIIEQGKGEAYGFELLLKKDKGKLTGWLAYTWSKSDRQFDNINNGLVFPYKYDRRHDFKIVMMYPLGKNTDFGANWIFTTGHAITLPLERIALNADQILYGYQGIWDLYTYDKKKQFQDAKLPSTRHFH
jgi:hypothetical protein